MLITVDICVRWFMQTRYVWLLALAGIALSSISIAQNKIDPNGYNVFYYDNGNISSEGMMRDGKPDGYWKTYYPDKLIKSEGNRKNFDLDSTWLFYDKVGNIAIEINYKSGLKSGLKKRYNDQGLLMAEENYSSNKRDKISKYYFEDGSIHLITNYEMDFKQGKSIEYGKEGYIISIRKYENDFMVDQELINRRDTRGLKTGVWKQFHHNGFVKLEGKYVKDKRHSFYREYSADGKLLNTYKYEHGELVENAVEFTDIKIDREYYPGAKVRSEMTLVNGVANGVYREYNIQGDVTAAKIYSQGHVTGEGIISKKGLKQFDWKEYYVLSMLNDSSEVLRATGDYKDNVKVGEWIFYHESGAIEQRGSYKNGKPTGNWKWFYESGNILREEVFIKGKENGLMVEYSDSGSVIIKGELVGGLKEGKWIYEMGDHREVGEYIDDKKHGIWQYFFNNGGLNFEGEFVDGDSNGIHKYYYENGKLMEEKSYIMGVKDGSWKKYDKEGNLSLVSVYEGGIEVKIDGVKVKLEADTDD